MTDKEMDALDEWLAVNGGIPLQKDGDLHYPRLYIRGNKWFLNPDDGPIVDWRPSRNRDQGKLLLEPFLDEWTIITTRWKNKREGRDSNYIIIAKKGHSLVSRSQNAEADTEEQALALLARRLIEWKQSQPTPEPTRPCTDTPDTSSDCSRMRMNSRSGSSPGDSA